MAMQSVFRSLYRATGARLQQPSLLLGVPSCSHGTLAEQSSEPDSLYKLVEMELRAHDRALLDSYETVVKQVCTNLDISIGRIETPRRPLLWRRDVLKSAFVHKKHRVQYETRTYRKMIDLLHLTGSTYDTVMEYFQRQLPEGVAMKVTKHEVLPLPDTVLQIASEADAQADTQTQAA